MRKNQSGRQHRAVVWIGPGPLQQRRAGRCRPVHQSSDRTAPGAFSARVLSSGPRPAEAGYRCALAAYRTAINQQPEFADAFYNLGLTLARKGELDESDHMLSQRPSTARRHTSLGISQYWIGTGKKGELDEAIKRHRVAIEQRNGDFPKAYYQLALALAGKATDHAQSPRFRKASTSTKAITRSLSGTRCAYYSAGEMTEAITHFKLRSNNAVEISRRALSVRQNLGQSWATGRGNCRTVNRR